MSQPKNFRSFYYTFFGKVLKSLILSDQAHYQLLQLRCSAPQLPCSEQDRRKEWLLWMLECSDLKTQLPSSSQFLPSVLASCAVSRRKTCPNCRVWNSTSPKSYGASWPKLLISGTSHVKLTPTSCRHLTSQKAAGHRLDVPPPALELLLSFGFLPHIRLCKVIKIYLNNNKAEATSQPKATRQHIPRQVVGWISGPLLLLGPYQVAFPASGSVPPLGSQFSSSKYQVACLFKSSWLRGSPIMRDKTEA